MLTELPDRLCGNFYVRADGRRRRLDRPFRRFLEVFGQIRQGTQQSWQSFVLCIPLTSSSFSWLATFSTFCPRSC